MLHRLSALGKHLLPAEAAAHASVNVRFPFDLKRVERDVTSIHAITGGSSNRRNRRTVRDVRPVLAALPKLHHDAQ